MLGRMNARIPDPLPGDTHSDVLIVGAGIVGLAHAWEAVQRGLTVQVIERDAACLGASVRNFGAITVTGQEAGDTWRRARRSSEVWSELAPQAGIPVLHRGLWLVAQRPEAARVLDAFMATPMAEACVLLSPAEAADRHPALRTELASAVLHSPHELRVESREAVPRLAAWLAERHGVRFRFGEAVLEVDAPRVRTSRGRYRADRVVVCTGAALNDLFADRYTPHRLQLCQLQMLRVRPEPGFRLQGTVMGDLTLVRYLGFARLPDAVVLRARLEDEEHDSLAHGVHLIVVQSADGSLVVGDSHHYGAAVPPFARSDVDEVILRHLRAALNLEQAQVTERWVGRYASSQEATVLIDAPDPATRLVNVTSGTGASTAFGIAEDVFAGW